MRCLSSRTSKMKHLVYLSLGSNQGDRALYIREAIRLIGEQIGIIEEVSSFIETEPVGFVSSFAFLNAALRLSTSLSPLALLKKLQQIEIALGRKQKSINGRHFDRTIDLDILLYDHITINTSELTIPHPRMAERDFVLRPLSEVLLTPTPIQQG